MDFLQLDAELLGTSSALLTGSSAIIAILASIEQMSSSARAIKNIEWMQNSLENQENSVRRQTLETMLVENQAKLISRQQVPLVYLSPILFWPLVVIVALYSASAEHDTIWGLVLSVSSSLIIGWSLIRMTIRAYCERVRIYYQFCSMKYTFRPAEIDLLALTEGGTRKEFAQSGVLFFGIILCIAPLILSVIDGLNIWRTIVILVGLIMIVLMLMFIRDYAYRLAGDPTGGVSAFQRRINVRETVSSVLGARLTKEIEEIDESLKTIEQLRSQIIDEAKEPIRVSANASIQNLKNDIKLIQNELENTRAQLASAEEQSTYTTLGETLARIDARIVQSKAYLNSIRYGGLE